MSGTILSRDRLLDVSFDVPSWSQIADSLRPNPPVEDGERLATRMAVFRDTSGGRLLLPTRCRATFDGHPTGDMVRSQSGPLAFHTLCFPTLPLTRSMHLCFGCFSSPTLAPPSLCFLPLAGVALPSTPLATTGVRVRFQGCWDEGGFARVCGEAGGRVTLNVRVSDLDLPPRGVPDQRRLEVVADGLPLFHDVQLAIDTTLVSAVRGDGRTWSAVPQGWGSTSAREATEGAHVP